MCNDFVSLSFFRRVLLDGIAIGRRYSRLVTVSCFIPLLVLSGCSDDGKKSSKSTPTTLVDVAVEYGELSTLISALQIAELDDELSDLSANYTVFAPTDAAFDALKQSMGDEAFAELLASDDLVNILLYHVVGDTYSSADVVGASGDLVSTLNGAPVAPVFQDGVVRINESNVVDADLWADNGIIHIVDQVILPPSDSIADLVAENMQLSTLGVAVSQAGLLSTLDEGGPFTVFAPTNSAFEKLGSEVVDSVLANQELLTNILTYHVVDGVVSASDAIALNGSSASMLNGEQATVFAVDNSLYIDSSKVSVTNILATNGVVHVIDSVMTPESVDVTDGNIVEILSADENFSTLVTAVSEANLVEALQTTEVTVFAPTNRAFAKLPAGTLEALLQDTASLTDILTYHVTAGSVDSQAALNAVGTSVTMLNGGSASLSQMESSLYIDDAKIIMTDIKAENGVIHVIDTVILPD